MTVKPIPEGYHTVTPYLVVSGAETLIEFLTQAFAAKEIRRTLDPEGDIMNAEVKIGDSMIMLGEAKGDCAPMPTMIYLYVENTDATYENALKAGATSTMQPKNEFWGDRSASVKDPNGNHWWIATHQEDVSSEDLETRIENYLATKQKCKV